MRKLVLAIKIQKQKSRWMLSTDLYERGVDVVPISARVQMETNSVVID